MSKTDPKLTPIAQYVRKKKHFSIFLNSDYEQYIPFSNYGSDIEGRIMITIKPKFTIKQKGQSHCLI